MVAIGVPESPYRCITASLFGITAFIAMSAWTCIFTYILHNALVRQSRPTGITCSHHLIGWAVPITLTLLMMPGHFDACQGSTLARLAMANSTVAKDLMTLELVVFRSVFIALPVLTSAVVICYYVDIRRHYRAHRSIAQPMIADNPSGMSEIGSAAANSTRRVTEKLDLRLLSYLVAYVLCELPGVPALIVPTDFNGTAPVADKIAVNDDSIYLTQQETNVLVAIRVLTCSAQGLINALVFAHHARQQARQRARWVSDAWRSSTDGESGLG